MKRKFASANLPLARPEPRKHCLGCPWLIRSAEAGDFGEPICVFGRQTASATRPPAIWRTGQRGVVSGERRRLFWEDVAGLSGTVCGHGVSARAVRPWTTGELRILADCIKRHGRRWKFEAAKILLRTPRSVDSAAYKAGFRHRKNRAWSAAEMAEITAAVRDYRGARDKLRRLTEKYSKNWDALIQLGKAAADRESSRRRSAKQRARELSRVARALAGREV